MAPVRRNPCFRHEPDDLSRYGAVQWKPIPTDPEDRSIAGKTMDMSSRRQHEHPPICGRIDRPLWPIKKRGASDSSSSGYSIADDSFVIPPKKKRRVGSSSDGGSARAASPNPTSSNAITAVTSQQLQQKKLTHDAIRSGGVLSDHRLLLHAAPRGMERAETSAAGAARAKKKTNRNVSKVPRRVAVTFVPTRPMSLSKELSHHLAELGVGDEDTAPEFVCMKMLESWINKCRSNARYLLPL